jgi:lipoprotein-anchoring transpeptidase ErfK/SrfK
MFRFSTSLLLTTGLLLTATLATISTSLHAQTTIDRSRDLHLKTSTEIMPHSVSNLVPVGSNLSQSSPTKPKADPSPLPSGTTTTSPVKLNGSTPTNPPQSPAVPTPTAKPTTTNSDRQPVENVINLVLKLKERKVYVYRGDKLIKRYPVAIGKKGWETPIGEWQVMEKIRNPAWTSFKTGEVFPPGVENPLGVRWIGFWTDGQDVIGFHGTPNVKSIGTAASHGCVRMLNRDVRALFPLVKVGTVVKVVNE